MIKESSPSPMRCPDAHDSDSVSRFLGTEMDLRALYRALTCSPPKQNCSETDIKIGSEAFKRRVTCACTALPKEERESPFKY